MCSCTACGDARSQGSGDDHNEGVDTITTPEITWDNKCRKKYASGVPEQARDIKKIHTWHGAVVESVTDFVRDQVKH